MPVSQQNSLRQQTSNFLFTDLFFDESAKYAKFLGAAVDRISSLLKKNLATDLADSRPAKNLPTMILLVSVSGRLFSEYILGTNYSDLDRPYVVRSFKAFCQSVIAYKSGNYSDPHSFNAEIDQIWRVADEVFGVQDFIDFFDTNVVFYSYVADDHFAQKVQEEVKEKNIRRVYRKADQRPRPDLPGNAEPNRLKQQFKIRMTPELISAVEIAAESEGVTRQDWIEQAVVARLQKR